MTGNNNIFRNIFFQECMARFPMPVNNLDKVPTSEKFILNTPSTSPAEQVNIMHRYGNFEFQHTNAIRLTIQVTLTYNLQ